MSEAPRTLFASAALRLAATLTAQVHKIRLGKDPVRQVKVLEPDGPSTAGGKLGRLSIVLVPESGSGQSLMFGWFDIGTNKAEIRSFESLAEQFQTRFDRAIDIERAAYEELAAKVTAFLTLEGYEISSPGKASDQPAPHQSSPAPPSASSTAPTTTQKLPTTSAKPAAGPTPRSNGFVIGVASFAFLVGLIAGAVIATLAGG